MASVRVKYNQSFEAEEGFWRLRAWVSEAEGMTEKIFVRQRLPVVPYQEAVRSIFSNVAQPSDLVDYPEDEPSGTSTYFRTGSLDLEFKSADLLASSLTRLEGDIRNLVLAMNETGA